MRELKSCIWFNGNGKEAAEFYCDVMQEAEIKADTPMLVEIEASGHRFICLNGGPKYQPNPSISFYYICESEEELDGIWEQMLKGGEERMALDQYPWSPKYGWIEDRFGVNWQLSLGKISDVGQKISPTLLFTQDQCGRAAEAVEHYTSIFKNSSVDGIMQRPDNEKLVAHAQFALNGQKFMAMDGPEDHKFSFSEGISIVVPCESQEEIDYFWERLSDGGMESHCGWLKDKFGVSWQVYPVLLEELMQDPAKGPQLAEVMRETRKFDLGKLEGI